MQEAADDGKVSLEERRFTAESADRKRDLDLKEREIILKEREAKRSRWSNPLVLGVFGAAVALVGNVIAYTSNERDEAVKARQFQSQLMIEAIKTGDPITACRNLEFFVSVGMLDDPLGNLGRACDFKRTPSLPSKSQSSESSASPNPGSQAPESTKPDHR